MKGSLTVVFKSIAGVRIFVIICLVVVVVFLFFEYLANSIKHSYFICILTVRCQTKIHKVNFKANNNTYFQHL